MSDIRFRFVTDVDRFTVGSGYTRLEQANVKFEIRLSHG